MTKRCSELGAPRAARGARDQDESCSATTRDKSVCAGWWRRPVNWQEGCSLMLAMSNPLTPNPKQPTVPGPRPRFNILYIFLGIWLLILAQDIFQYNRNV